MTKSLSLTLYFLAVVGCLLVTMPEPSQARDGFHGRKRMTVDPRTGKIADYNLKSVRHSPVAWGDQPSGASAGTEGQPRPGMSLGSVGSPAGVSSTGLSIYETYMDAQYVGTGRRLVDFRGPRPDIHFVYSRNETPLGNSRFGYTVYDPTTGTWPLTLGAGCVIQGVSSAQEVSLDVNGRGLVVMGGIAGSSGSEDNRFYYQNLAYDCSFGTGTTISHLQYDDYFLDKAGYNHLYEPSVEVQEWAGDTVVHVLAREQYSTPSGAEFSQYTLSYFRKPGADAGGTWEGPTVVDTVNVVSVLTGPQNGSIAASRVSPKVAIVYSHWKTTSPLPAREMRYDNDIWYRISDSMGLSWGPKTNLTSYSRTTASATAFISTSCLWDHQGFLHVIWSATKTPANVYSNPNYFWGDYSCSIYHWSDRTLQISKVHNADWGINYNYLVCGFGSPGTGYVGFYTISECENRLYVVFNQYLNPFGNDESPTTPANLDDCASGGWTARQYAANGEIYVVTSTDLDGTAWDASRNVTKSYTPGCDSAGFGGPCMNDARPSLSRFGMEAATYDTGGVPVSLIWPGGELVDLTPAGDPPDTGQNYLMLFYTEDHFPAPAFLDRSGDNKFGRATLNPLRWVRLACAEPIRAPQITIDSSIIGYPDYTPHGTERLFAVTVTNEGTAPLIVSQIKGIETTQTKFPWLRIVPTSLTIPAGAGNQATLLIHMNDGGIINSPGTIVELSGLIYLKSNAKPPRDSIEIFIDRFLVVTAITPRVWDTISTLCTRLTVAPNGQIGRSGVGRVNMDYAQLGGDCDLNALIYLYDGSPIVVRRNGAEYRLGNNLWHGDYNSDKSFKIAGVSSTTLTGPGFDGYRTRTFVTTDSAIGAVRSYYAPNASQDTCNFIVVKTQFFGFNGPTDHVTLGDVVDWDIPSDSAAMNDGRMLSSRGLVYMQGTDTSVNGCQLNTRRFGALALLGMYSSSEWNLDTCSNDRNTYGGYVGLNDSLVNYVGLSASAEGEYWWSKMGAQAGLNPDGINGKDVHLVLTYKHDISLTDTLTVYTAILSIKNGDTTDLKRTMDKAERWYIRHLRGSCVASSCCQEYSSDGRAGNVDCDPGLGVDISDLSALIDNLYITFMPLCCESSANVDGDPAGGVDISDLSALIDYLYISFVPPMPCR